MNEILSSKNFTKSKVKIFISDDAFAFLSRFNTREFFFDSEFWVSIEQYYQYCRHRQTPSLRKKIKKEYSTHYQLKRTVDAIDVINMKQDFPIPVNVSRKYKDLVLPSKYSSCKLTEATIEKFKQHRYLVPSLISTKSYSIVDPELPEYVSVINAARVVCKKFIYSCEFNFEELSLTEVEKVASKIAQNSTMNDVIKVLTADSSRKYVKFCLEVLNSLDTNECFLSNIDKIGEIVNLIKSKVKKERNEVAILIAIFVYNLGKKRWST